MERSIEWFVALTSLVMGASHVLQPASWVEAYATLHRLGRPGAFVNGAMSLIPGAVVVTGHAVWSWPGAPLTVFGWLLVAKGAGGGGVKGGVSHEPSDEFGYKPADRRNPTQVYDLHATVLHLLGIDHEKLTVRHDSIDRRLTDVHGRVITEILA